MRALPRGLYQLRVGTKAMLLPRPKRPPRGPWHVSPLCSQTHSSHNQSDVIKIERLDREVEEKLLQLLHQL